MKCMNDKNSIEVWNALTDLYDGQQHEMSYDEAENVLIAWPPILEFIHTQAHPGARVLDFGCGAGGFACELGSRGYKVLGVDPASNMVEAASRSMPDNVHFLVGDANIAVSQGQFDVLTAVMVLQFVEDLDATLRILSRSLVSKSSIVLAVFNPAWIRRCAEEGYDEEYRFTGFHDPKHPEQGFMDFGEHGSAPVFLRTANEYDAVMSDMGFSRKMECMPPFTDEFLQKYMRPGPVNIPEFLILGYGRE